MPAQSLNGPAMRRMRLGERSSAAMVAVVAALQLVLLMQQANPSEADFAAQASGPTVTDAKSFEKPHESGPEWLAVAKARGYIGEMYRVPSKDGTPLQMYHLINPLADQKTLYRFPVLELHGLLGDAAQMISHSEESSARAPKIGEITVLPTDTALAFMLSNNNFDVWMFDSRGVNMNTRKYSYDYSAEGQKFWNFSYDEEIQLDTPAAIDFVLEQTHSEKTHLIGYSESTVYTFGMLSMKPEYADKLASASLLAPIAYIGSITSAGLAVLVPPAFLPDSVNGNYVPQVFTDLVVGPVRQLCQSEIVKKTICTGLAGTISGFGPDNISHGFAAIDYKATSIKAIRQLNQWYTQKQFQMYDYGEKGNMKAYGQPKPPIYDIRRIRFPWFILVRGDRDVLSDPADQERLLKNLGSKPYIDLHYPNYDHLAMVASRTVVDDVNLPISRAILTLTKIQTAQWGSMLKTAEQLLAPRKLKPMAVVLPDGNRRIEIRNDLAFNLFESVVESTGLTPELVPQLKQIGDAIDSASSTVSKVADIAGLGSIQSD